MYQRELAKLKEQRKGRKGRVAKSVTAADKKEGEERVEVVDQQEGDNAAAVLRNVRTLYYLFLFILSFLGSSSFCTSYLTSTPCYMYLSSCFVSEFLQTTWAPKQKVLFTYNSFFVPFVVVGLQWRGCHATI